MQSQTTLTVIPSDVPTARPLLEESPFATPWALMCWCSEEAPIYLTQESFQSQALRLDWGWTCPRCGQFCELDHVNLNMWHSQMAIEARADYEWELRQAR